MAGKNKGGREIRKPKQPKKAKAAQSHSIVEAKPRKVGPGGRPAKGG